MIVRSTIPDNKPTAEYVTDLTIGSQIRKIRKQRKLSIEKLAASVEISSQHLQKIEAGMIASSSVTIAALALELDRSISDFFHVDVSSAPVNDPSEHFEEQLLSDLSDLISAMNVKQVEAMVAFARYLKS